METTSKAWEDAELSGALGKAVESTVAGGKVVAQELNGWPTAVRGNSEGGTRWRVINGRNEHGVRVKSNSLSPLLGPRGGLQAAASGPSPADERESKHLQAIARGTFTCHPSWREACLERN